MLVCSVRSELTFHHREAKEVQLFDAKKLSHSVKNILPRGLGLEKQRSVYSVCVQTPSAAAKSLSMWSVKDVLNTYTNSDVQLVFVGEEDTDRSLLLRGVRHDVFSLCVG